MSVFAIMHSQGKQSNLLKRLFNKNTSKHFYGLPWTRYKKQHENILFKGCVTLTNQAASFLNEMHNKTKTSLTDPAVRLNQELLQ